MSDDWKYPDVPARTVPVPHRLPPRLERWAKAFYWQEVAQMRRQGLTIAAQAKATGISKRRLYKHWRVR